MACVSSYVGDLFPSFSSVIVFPIIFCLVKAMGEAQLSPISPSTSSEHHDTRLNYDFAVILAAMICALLCALGLNSMLQCIVQCTRHALTEPIRWIESRQMNAGLKRSDVKTLPITTYAASSSSPASAPAPAGCAICLVDFSDGEKIRVLPICGHRFHVTCIDTWLMSHCSCPTCRHRLFPSHQSEPAVEIVTSP